MVRSSSCDRGPIPSTTKGWNHSHQLGLNDPGNVGSRWVSSARQRGCRSAPLVSIQLCYAFSDGVAAQPGGWWRNISKDVGSQLLDYSIHAMLVLLDLPNQNPSPKLWTSVIPGVEMQTQQPQGVEETGVFKQLLGSVSDPRQFKIIFYSMVCARVAPLDTASSGALLARCRWEWRLNGPTRGCLTRRVDGLPGTMGVFSEARVLICPTKGNSLSKEHRGCIVFRTSFARSSTRSNKLRAFVSRVRVPTRISFASLAIHSCARHQVVDISIASARLNLYLYMCLCFSHIVSSRWLRC